MHSTSDPHHDHEHGHAAPHDHAAPASNVERFLWLFPLVVVLALVGALLATT